MDLYKSRLYSQTSLVYSTCLLDCVLLLFVLKILNLHAVYLILNKSEYFQPLLCQGHHNPSTITSRYGNYGRSY